MNLENKEKEECFCEGDEQLAPHCLACYDIAVYDQIAEEFFVSRTGTLYGLIAFRPKEVKVKGKKIFPNDRHGFVYMFDSNPELDWPHEYHLLLLKKNYETGNIEKHDHKLSNPPSNALVNLSDEVEDEREEIYLDGEPSCFCKQAADDLAKQFSDNENIIIEYTDDWIFVNCSTKSAKKRAKLILGKKPYSWKGFPVELERSRLDSEVRGGEHH